MKKRKIQTIQAKQGIGIWGNIECIQCGACCYEYNLYLYQCKEKETEQCENFYIKDSKAYCLAHENKRKQLCEEHFCGNVHFDTRFEFNGDKILRKIAEQLGTTPSKYKIPIKIKRKIKVTIKKQNQK